MERLPIELVIHILEYMSTEELKIFGFLSSEYRSLVIPLLFHRIRPWRWGAANWGVSDLISCLRNNHRLSTVVRVLDVQTIAKCQQPLEELRQIMKITARWEGLILPADEYIPLEVFDDNTRLRLRRLKFTHGTGFAGRKLSHLLLYILPSCVNLIDLEIPEQQEHLIKTCDPNGSAIAIWMNRLEKYHGPSYPLDYIRNGTPLHRLISTNPAPSSVLQRLGQLVGQQLLTLHVYMSLTRDHDFALVGKDYLSPSLFPSSFPNVRYVSWFLITPHTESAPGDSVRICLTPSLLLIVHIQGLSQTKTLGDEATLDVNRTLFDAIRQLHYLRHVWFTSHHDSRAPIGPVLTFVKEVQRMTLPYLHRISLWAPNRDPWSYAFRKEEAESVSGGGHAKWVCEKNVSVSPLIG